MLFGRIVRVGPEKVFASVRNADTMTLVNGDVVIWKTAAPVTYPGTDVLQAPTGTTGSVLLAGVVSGNSIVAGDYGLMQVYGFHASVKSASSTAGVSQGTITGTAGTCNDVADPSPAGLLGLCVVATATSRAGVIIQKL